MVNNLFNLDGKLKSSDLAQILKQKRGSFLHSASPGQKGLNKNITMEGKFIFPNSQQGSPTMTYRKSALVGNLKKTETNIAERPNENNPAVRRQKRQKTVLEMKKTIEVYKGEYDDHNFIYNGMGNLMDQEIFLYEGTFRMGKKHGYGYEFRIPDNLDYKIFYRGEWENNLEDGCGFLIKSDKNIKIFQEGNFEKGIFKHGKQIRIEELDKDSYISENYIGLIVDNMYHGEGSLKRKYIKISSYGDRVEIDQEYEYEGQFERNKENGKGVSKKKLHQTGYNYTYKGEFVDGLMHGYGSIEFEGEYYIKTYEGLFQQDKWCCFYGRVEFKSGDIYEGFFDKNHGKSEIGLYFHNDKNKTDRKANRIDHFFGEYKNDKKHGLGKFLIQGNQLLIGRYDDGEKNGNFCLIQEDEEEIKIKNTFGIHKNNIDRRSSKSLSLLKQNKTYYLFENDEGIDKSDKPFKD
jgi:hypothetical protein